MAKHSGPMTRFNWQGSLTAFTVVVLGVLAMVNVYAARHPQRVDLTADKRHSLSQASQDLMRSLTVPVTVHAIFMADNPGADPVRDLLKQYQSASSGKVTFDVVDPRKQPGLVRQYDVISDGTVVLTAGNRTEKIEPRDMFSLDPSAGENAGIEQAISSAILRVTQAKQRTAYFLSGHGEEDLQDAQEQLQTRGFAVKTLDLIEKKDVPVDADLVVVAGPKKDILAAERTALAKWAGPEKGLAVLLDPVLPANPPFPELASLVGRWGVGFESSVVVEAVRNYNGDQAVPIPLWQDHPITEKLQSYFVAMPLPRALKQTDAKANVSPLLVTTRDSFAATGQPLKVDGQARGPFTLALAAGGGTGAEGGEKLGRLIAFGNSAFVSSQLPAELRGQIVNMDFFVQSLEWATGQEAGLAISPKVALSRDILLTGTDQRNLFLTFVLGLPLALLILGGIVWRRRRYL